jgi:hypothetical protein
MNRNRLRLTHRLVLVAATASWVMLALSGCATIIRGTTERVSFQSEPSGALVRLSNGFTGRTPVSFTVPRKGDLTVQVEKEGYEPMKMTLRATMGGGGAATNVAGNTAAAAGTIVLVGSSVTVQGTGLAGEVVAASLATPLAVIGGAVLVGGIITDINSGAMLSHGKGPYRFLLKRLPEPPGGAAPRPESAPAPAAPDGPAPRQAETKESS